MSIVDDLVSNLIERNAIRLNGNLNVSLVDGGLAINGQVLATLRDQKRNKDVLLIKAPVDADVRVNDIVIPLPQNR